MVRPPARRASRGPPDGAAPAGRPDLAADLAPRRLARPPILLQDPEADDPRTEGDLWRLTRALMHLWAGESAPGAVEAGLAGHEAPEVPAPGTTSDIVALVGLLLGAWTLVVARRRLTA